LMIAGTLSKGANVRLTTEVSRPNLTIFDLKWLIEKFTQHYPYIFFESSICEYIEKKIEELETKHVLADRVRSLTDYYVPQSIGVLDRIIEITPEAVFSIVSEITPIESLKEAIKSRQKLLIAGEPGVGKSTAMHKLAIDLLSKSLEQATRKKAEILEIPLLVKARDLIVIEELKELIERFGPPPEIRKRFKINALLVDALDEAPGESRETIANKAIEFASALGCALFITSRKIDLVRKESIRLEKRELLPLQYGQALTLCDRLIQDKTKLDALKSGLKTIQNQLIMTPLTLLLLIDLVEADREIPSSLVLLYNKFFDLALGVEDRLRKGLEILFEPEIKKNFLSELAYHEFFLKSRDTIGKEEFNRFLEEYAAKFQWDAKQLRLFVSEMERAGILDIREVVSFVHNTFLDYFIALRIYDNREEIPDLDSYLTKMYFDSWWYDVVFYYAGLKQAITKDLIDSIIRYTERGEKDIIDCVSKVLVGKLLQAAWRSPAEVKMHGIKESQAFCANIKGLFLDLIKQRYPDMPTIYSDIYALMICETAYGSRHLWNQERRLIDEYLQEPNHEHILRAIQLLWANKDRIPQEEKDSLMKQLYAATTATTKEDIEGYARNLLLLRVLSVGNKALYKAIEKRLTRQYELHPELFERLVPSRKSGFRSKKAIEAARRKKLARKKKS